VYDQYQFSTASCFFCVRNAVLLQLLLLMLLLFGLSDHIIPRLSTMLYLHACKSGLFAAARLSAIAGQLSPGLDSSGIQVLEADTFKLQSFVSVTGECTEEKV
jgi:hypothetical protein